MATIKQIKDTNGNIHDILSTIGYGTCATAAATAAKVATISDTSWTLKVGTIIGIKFTNSNSAGSTTTPVTLNVNSTGAKNIWYNNASYTGTSTSICGYANRVLFYMYDGTYWVWMNMGSLDGNSNTVPSAQCETASATAAKTATCTNYSLLSKSFLHVNVRYSNTSKTAITLNVNSNGAKPIYINGAASSTSNYTLPAGTYIVYYDGTNYYFRTDGKLTADITGKADALTSTSKGSATQPVYFNANGKPVACTYTLGKSVPSDAKFTDTTYTALKNPKDIKFKNALGTVITYDGSIAADLSGGVYNATNAINATNLTAKPSLAASGNNITVTAGGKTSDAFTVPYATSAGSAEVANNASHAETATDADNADKLNIGLGAGSGEKKLSICTTTLAQSGGYGDVYQIPNIYLNDEDSIFIIGYDTVINSTCEVNNDLYVTDGDIICDSNISAGGVIIGDLSGKADFADALTVSSKGSATQPVYFDANGKPVACTYTLGKSVPSDAKFTDTTYTALKNPNAIKFKNALGTEITYDGSIAVNLSGGVYSATNATNATKVNISTTDANDGLPILFTTWKSNPSNATTAGVAGNRALYMDDANSFYFNASSNTVHSSGGFFETSDERLKDIINPITVDLDKLSKLRKVYFNWKDKPDSNLQLGMIAQDVQELYPELVSETNGELSLSYDRLSVIALEAIDVLHNENNELKSRIEKLESLVNQLAEKVND